MQARIATLIYIKLLLQNPQGGSVGGRLLPHSSVQVVFVEACDLDQVSWVEDDEVAAAEVHGANCTKLAQDAVDVDGRHTQRLGEDDLGQWQDDGAAGGSADAGGP